MWWHQRFAYLSCTGYPTPQITYLQSTIFIYKKDTKIVNKWPSSGKVCNPRAEKSYQTICKNFWERVRQLLFDLQTEFSTGRSFPLRLQWLDSINWRHKLETESSHPMNPIHLSRHLLPSSICSKRKLGSGTIARSKTQALQREMGASYLVGQIHAPAIKLQ